MTDTERAAALADKITQHPAGIVGVLDDIADEVTSDGPDPLEPVEALIVAALRAFSPPPADVREAVAPDDLGLEVAMAIEATAKIAFQDHNWRLGNPGECARSAIATLQAAGWGPRAETPAARDVLAKARATLTSMTQACQLVDEIAARTYRARNGRQVSIEADDGECCWIVHDDGIQTLRQAVAAGVDALAEIESIDRAEKGGA